MPDYVNMPRQRGLSANPLYVANPRKFARTRCEKAANSCDRVLMYMGELIQTYIPEDMTPNDGYKHGIALADYAMENNLDLGALVDMSMQATVEFGELGKFAGYIAVASVIMRSVQELRDTINELKSTI